MAAHFQEFFYYCNWSHWRITARYKDPRTFSELVILPLHKKKCEMGICKLKIVYSQFPQIIPMKEAKESQCKQRSNLNIPQWPCSSWRITLVTSLTSKALLWLGGLAKIYWPPSATCWTMGWSLNSWQLLFFSTQLEPYTAEFSSETELPCWIRCTKYRAEITQFAGEAVYPCLICPNIWTDCPWCSILN